MSDDDYTRRAEALKPDDPAALAAAAHELARQGLSVVDIGNALRLSADAVRALFEEVA